MTAGPVFLLASARSGSTLLRVMLAGHPRLFSPPELHLLGHHAMKDREKALVRHHTIKDDEKAPVGCGCRSHRSCDERPGLVRALMELRRIEWPAARQMVNGMIERNEAIADVYKLLFHLAAPRRLVDKTPAYSSKIEILASAEKLFPDAHYIHLHRHPRAVMNSITRGRTDYNTSAAQKRWRDSNANCLKFLEKVAPGRQIRVSYEQMVATPEPVMRGICDLLEIEFHPALLTPYDGERMTDGVQVGIGDPGFKNHSDIDKSLAYRGLDLDLPLEEETWRTAEALGYEVRTKMSLRR